MGRAGRLPSHLQEISHSLDTYALPEDPSLAPQSTEVFPLLLTSKGPSVLLLQAQQLRVMPEKGLSWSLNAFNEIALPFPKGSLTDGILDQAGSFGAKCFCYQTTQILLPP